MRFDDYRNDAYDELDDYEYDRRGDMGARSDFPAPALEVRFAVRHCPPRFHAQCPRQAH